MNFKEFAKRSASIYYKYALDYNKGNIEYTVRNIDENAPFFDLHITTAIPSTEHLKIQIKETLYEEDQIKILEYDPQAHIVKILAKPEYSTLIKEAAVSDVLLVANVRFLIKRTEDWYAKYGDRVCLPNTAPSVAHYEPRKIKDTPSNDQYTAIKGILKAPLTYVWGAPGTGKTQIVLARTLLTYIKRKKRVLITAPTNRAVEQILYAILPILESVDIPYEKVLRLGIPTTEFAQKYPTVCESHQIRTELAKAQASIETTKLRIEHLKEQVVLQKRWRNYKDARSKFDICVTNVRCGFDSLHKLEQDKDQLLGDIEALTIKKSHYIKELAVLSQNIGKEKDKLRQTNRQLQKLKTSVFRYFYQNKIESFEQQLSCSIEQLNALEAKQKALIESKDNNAAILIQTQKKLDELHGKHKNLAAQLKNHFKLFLELHLLREKDFHQQKDWKKNIYLAIQKGQELFNKKEIEYRNVTPIDTRETISTIHQLEQQLERLKTAFSDLSDRQTLRKDKCQILAVTIDGCLTKVLPDGDFIPDHIFLDEAGYASLIKAATLTAFHCPLTLLGDHMQLPPVCEINDEQLQDQGLAPVVLWAQSALYLEDLFTVPFEDLLYRYLKHQPPFFKNLKKYDLLHSFRFSNSLASILAGEIYSTALEGTDTHHTDIFYINVPTKIKKTPAKDEQKRYNPAECDAIKEFIFQHDDLEVGIITPYKNQKNALRKNIPNHIEVNTVHGSQGREWDCVVLSVVDTTNRWFTDSLLEKSNGKFVINTAVSRAKKQLVLVCDANYWSTQKNQLIGKLLSVAREIKL